MGNDGHRRIYIAYIASPFHIHTSTIEHRTHIPFHSANPKCALRPIVSIVYLFCVGILGILVRPFPFSFRVFGRSSGVYQLGRETSCYQHQRRWIEHGRTNEKEKKERRSKLRRLSGEGGPLCAWFALNVFALDSVWCSSGDFQLDVRFDTELWCQQRTTMADLVCHLLFIRPHLTATTSSNEVVFVRFLSVTKRHE